MNSGCSSLQNRQLPIVLLAYAVFAVVFGFDYRYVINPDGISLLRLAGYIAEGDFLRSVTSSWSPLFTWIVSPFIYMGFDGMVAARIATALIGAGLLLCGWYLTDRFDLSPSSRFVSALIAALLISFWTIQFIAADVLFAALMLYYIYLVTGQDVINRSKIAFWCGVVGGFSYLAHHYAFPFFLVHLPVMLLLKGFTERVSMKRIFFSWAAAMAGFFLVASLWIGVVSVKYGQFTISSKGPIARASIGPEDRGHPFFAGGLYKPRDAYAVHVFEDPSEVKFKTWSPFESREYFLYQLKLMKKNVLHIVNHFVSMSPFFTYAFMIGVLTLIMLALLLRPFNEKKKYLYSWFVLTFSIFCSGFVILIAQSPRRFYVPMALFLFLAFHFLDDLKEICAGMAAGPRKKLLILYLFIIFICAFSYKPGVQFVKSIHNILVIERVNPYQEMTEQINTIDFSSPYAIIRTAQKPHTDYYFAYFIGKQLLGRPLADDTDGITEELRGAGARSLLVFDSPEIVESLKIDERYRHIGHKRFRKDSRYLYAVNTAQDNIKGWDREIDVFVLKRQ